MINLGEYCRLLGIRLFHQKSPCESGKLGARPGRVLSNFYLAGPIRTSQEEHSILPVIVLDYFGNCATLCLRADLECGATCSIHRPLRDYGVERNYESLRKDTANKAKRTIRTIRVESVCKRNPSGHHEK